MTENEQSGLGGKFGAKTTGSQINYGHPNSQQILDSAVAIIRESERGRLLLKLLDFKRVPVHIIKGMGQSGFSPEAMTIYLQVPGSVSMATPAFTISLIKALNEAAQELAGFKTPDPRKDIMAYATFIHGRNLDSITEVCRVIKELTNTSHFTNLLDSLTELGLNGVYKAYIDGKPREALYEQYAAAYDAVRGRS